MNVAITGGARGIGRATAQACTHAGLRVAIGDLDHAASESAASEIGGGSVGLALDVRDRGSFTAFLDAAEESLGPLDVLVNNAGVAFMSRLEAEDPARIRQTVEVNLLGVITGCQLALQRFLPRDHGHIVNVASITGALAVPGSATMSATKHAVVGLTRAVRAEIRGTGVRITVVMPGIVNTEMIGGFAVIRTTRIMDPSAVGKAIVDALRTGRAEVFVPPELALAARLVGGLPPRVADLLKRLFGADAVMGDADLMARTGYERRAADQREPGKSR